MFIHDEKALAADCHVDDLIVACELGWLEWLLEAMRKTLRSVNQGFFLRMTNQKMRPFDA